MEKIPSSSKMMNVFEAAHTFYKIFEAFVSLNEII
jgi:hypothetical protein